MLFRSVIAGSGEEAYENQLKARVTGKGLTDVVRFAGWVDGEEKRNLLQRASLFALPSKHENFGVAVLEALTAGVPAIISRDVQLAPELATANAGWVVDATHEALAMALNHAMSHEQLRADRGRAAAKLAKQFAWPAVATRMVELYTDRKSTRLNSSHT